MEFSLSDREQHVRRAFYRQFDNYPGGVFWYVHAVYEADLVAYAEHLEKWFRLGYTFNPEAEPTERVTFADESTWQEVTWTWIEVQRSLEDLKREKRAFLGEIETRDFPGAGTVLHRTFRAEVRRSEDGKRVTVVINTDAIDGHRTIVDPAGGEWDEFRGKFYINHDLNLLAGRSPTPSLRGGQWVVTVEDDAWDHDDPEIERWYRKVKAGLCDEVSLGFQPIEGRWETIDEQRVFRYTRWKGREWSFVGMGSNPEAVVTERAQPKGDVTSPNDTSSSQTEAAKPAPSAAAKEPETDVHASEARSEAAAESPVEAAPPLRFVTPAELRAAQSRREKRAIEIAKRRLGRA